MLEKTLKQKRRGWTMGILCLLIICFVAIAFSKPSQKPYGYYAFSDRTGISPESEALTLSIGSTIAAISFSVALVYTARNYIIERKAIPNSVEDLKTSGQSVVAKIQSIDEINVFYRSMDYLEYYLCTAEINGETRVFKSNQVESYRTKKVVDDTCIIYYDENENYFVDVDSDLKDN